MSVEIAKGRAIGIGPETGVFAVIQAQINAQQLMLDEIRQVKTDVLTIRTELTSMYHDLKDSITLLDAEKDILHSIVNTEAYRAAKVYVIEDGEGYPTQGSAEEAKIREMAGFGMRYLWKRLKDNFGVTKYIHIRRVDFESAKRFLRGIHLGGEFEQHYENWVRSREELKRRRAAKQ